MLFKESFSPFTGFVAPTARSLRHLLEIRAHHLKHLRAMPGYLGSAIGFKTVSPTFGEPAPAPAILVFLATKPPRAKGGGLPTLLGATRGLVAATDLIVTPLATDDAPHLPPSPPDTRETPTGSAPKPTSVADCGLALVSDEAGGVAAGALRHRRTAQPLGLLTSSEFARRPGTPIRAHRANGALVATGSAGLVLPTLPLQQSTSGTLAAYRGDARYRVGASLVRFPERAPAPTLAPDSRRPSRQLPIPEPAKLRPLDLDAELAVSDSRPTLGPLGATVESQAHGTGTRQGRVIACAYEWCTDTRLAPAERTYDFTDYLIAGPDGGAFAGTDEAGSLLCTETDGRAFALLWSPTGPSIPGSGAQRRWAYASAIAPVLEAFDAELIGAP